MEMVEVGLLIALGIALFALYCSCPAVTTPKAFNVPGPFRTMLRKRSGG
jgi:hypothetical protein